MEVIERRLEQGALAHPSSGGHPGVVLIHDVWGLGDHARDLTRRLAAEGFAVLAVDLYRRLGEVRIDDPGAFMRDLSDPQVLADVGEAAAVLAALPQCAGGGVGVVGFCMGGSYALMAGCAEPVDAEPLRGVAAVVPFYGILSHEHGLLHAEQGLDPAKKPLQPLDAARSLRRPLLAFFGDEDAFVPLADVEALKERLDRLPVSTEVVVYPGAGHAFANDSRPQAYRPEAARDAWSRMVAFFRRHLPGSGGGDGG